MLLIRFLVPLLFLSPVPATVIPPELACLARYYEARVDAGGVILPDGARIPYDDGKTKTADERLEHPDVRDVFVQRYHTGPIAPVTTPDEDPGRTRLDALFRAVYPASGVRSVPFLGRKIMIHARAAAPFAAVAARLESLVATDPSLRKFLSPLGGTLNVRKIAGTDRMSAHSYGVAIDLNPALSDYWRWEKHGWKNQIPQSIVDAFEAEGFIWGGRWAHFDTMHFEFRPELIDAACYPPDRSITTPSAR